VALAPLPRQPSGWQCLVSFPDQSESFVLGFEAGKLWRLLEIGEEVNSWPDHELAHIANLELYQRFATHFRCDLYVDDSGDGCWCAVTFVPVKPKLRIA